MALNTQKFSVIVSNAVTAVQGAASVLVDFTVGSISLAYMQAVSAIALWLQGLALQIAALTRLATSTGNDVDTWLADFGFFRLSAVPATGTVTFSRLTPTQQALIPVGTSVQTADLTQEFFVIQDTTQAAYNASLNAYVIAAGTGSCNATVQAAVAGTAGNVASGLIAVLGSSVVGVDTVTNASAFTSGQTSESDTAVKIRFVLYLASLTQGTPAAVRNAALGVQEGARGFLTENQNYSGLPQNGYFYWIADDGTGFPSDAFVSETYAAIDRVRAIGTVFGVFKPVVVTANVVMGIKVTAGYTALTVTTQVAAAITAYINALNEAQTLDFLRLPQIAFDTTPGVANVPLANLTLNGGTADLTATGQQLVRAGAVTVTSI